MHRRFQLSTAEIQRAFTQALGTMYLKRAVHISPTQPTTSAHKPALLFPLNA